MDVGVSRGGVSSGIGEEVSSSASGDSSLTMTTSLSGVRAGVVSASFFRDLSPLVLLSSEDACVFFDRVDRFFCRRQTSQR